VGEIIYIESPLLRDLAQHFRQRENEKSPMTSHETELLRQMLNGRENKTCLTVRLYISEMAKRGRLQLLLGSLLLHLGLNQRQTAVSERGRGDSGRS